MSQTKSKSIGIIGSGLIGKSWAMLYASVGYNVVLYDVVPEQVQKAEKDIKAQIKQYESENILRGDIPADQQISLISGTTDLQTCLKDKLLVQECIPEVLKLKQQLYQQVDKLLDDTTILSSSTSTFLPSVLAKGMQHKSQVLVMHPVNPPYFVPLVEIVPSAWTSPAVTKKGRELMEELGQAPVSLSTEIPGFALNRIQYAILNECWHLIQDGILSVADVDKVMSEGLGMRYAFLGPMETAHLNAEGFANYSQRYSDSMYETCKTFKPIPKLSGPQAQVVSEELSKITPIEKLSQRRTWRDVAITKLSQLKKQLNR